MCTQSYPTLHNPFGLQSARLLCPQDFSGKNTRVGCHFLLQGIFPTQGLKLCCLHHRQIFTAEPLEKALTNLDHFKFYLIILALCIISEVILIVIFTYSSLRLNHLLNSFSYIHSHRERDICIWQEQLINHYTICSSSFCNIQDKEKPNNTI